VFGEPPHEHFWEPLGTDISALPASGSARSPSVLHLTAIFLCRSPRAPRNGGGLALLQRQQLEMSELRQGKRTLERLLEVYKNPASVKVTVLVNSNSKLPGSIIKLEVDQTAGIPGLARKAATELFSKLEKSEVPVEAIPVERLYSSAEVPDGILSIVSGSVWRLRYALQESDSVPFYDATVFKKEPHGSIAFKGPTSDAWKSALPAEIQAKLFRKLVFLMKRGWHLLLHTNHTFLVHVVAITGKKFSLRLRVDATVGKLAGAIEEREGIKACDQRLIFAGSQL